MVLGAKKKVYKKKEEEVGHHTIEDRGGEYP